MAHGFQACRTRAERMLVLVGEQLPPQLRESNTWSGTILTPSCTSSIVPAAPSQHPLLDLGVGTPSRPQVLKEILSLTSQRSVDGVEHHNMVTFFYTIFRCVVGLNHGAKSRAPVCRCRPFCLLGFHIQTRVRNYVLVISAGTVSECWCGLPLSCPCGHCPKCFRQRKPWFSRRFFFFLQLLAPSQAPGCERGLRFFATLTLQACEVSCVCLWSGRFQDSTEKGVRAQSVKKTDTSRHPLLLNVTFLHLLLSENT